MASSGIHVDTYVSSVLTSKYEFEWIIKNFNAWLATVEAKSSSAKFPYDTDENEQFVLNFRPKAVVDGTFCSLFLQLVSPMEPQEKFFVQAELSMVDSKGCVIQSLLLNANYGTNKEWGYCNFVKRDYLLEMVKPADELCIKCKISAKPEIRNVLLKRSRKQLSKPLPSSLSRELRNLVDSEKFGDVTILIDGQRFLAYKGILSARSAVFAAMFEHQMLENRENCLSISDVEPAVFKELLRYIYADEVTCLEAMAHKLYAAADKYAISTLKSLCRCYILEKLNWETAAETLVLADMHSDNDMKEQALEFLGGHDTGKVTSTAGWRKMIHTHPYLVDETVKVLAARKTASKD